MGYSAEIIERIYERMGEIPLPMLRKQRKSKKKPSSHSSLLTAGGEHGFLSNNKWPEPEYYEGEYVIGIYSISDSNNSTVAKVKLTHLKLTHSKLTHSYTYLDVDISHILQQARKDGSLSRNRLKKVKKYSKPLPEPVMKTIHDEVKQAVARYLSKYRV
jgi:hypothetical protein